MSQWGQCTCPNLVSNKFLESDEELFKCNHLLESLGIEDIVVNVQYICIRKRSDWRMLNWTLDMYIGSIDQSECSFMVVTFVNNDLSVNIAEVERQKGFVAFINFAEYGIDCWYWVWVKIFQHFVEGSLKLVTTWILLTVKTGLFEAFSIVASFDDLFSRS